MTNHWRDIRHADLILVNGANPATLPFPSTGAWTNWSTQTLVVSLRSGTNTVRVTATTADGLANLDSLAVDTAPRNVREFQAYRAAWLTRSLTRLNVGYWVYSTGVPTSAPTILAQLTPDHGFERVAGWSFPVEGAAPIEVAVFRVDLKRLAFDATKLYAAPDALDRMVTLLEEHPEEGSGVAARLAEHVIVVPDGPAAVAALGRLGALAAN